MKYAWQPLIIRYTSCASTNDEALEQARRGAREGVCVVAQSQTAGRGRQQRAWSSPPGAGLYVSVVTRPQLAVTHWPLITLAASLAVADSLAETCGLTVNLKWPNDVQTLDGRKICGILAETATTQTGTACIVGIGINLLHRVWPPQLRDIATSIEEQTARHVNAETVLESLLRCFGVHYATLHAPAGPPQIIAAWSVRSTYATNRRVQVKCGKETLFGITEGLAEDGALLLRDDNGTLHLVRAGDVTALRARQK